jgi:hypothetical protein
LAWYEAIIQERNGWRTNGATVRFRGAAGSSNYEALALFFGISCVASCYIFDPSTYPTVRPEFRRRIGGAARPAGAIGTADVLARVAEALSFPDAKRAGWRP